MPSASNTSCIELCRVQGDRVAPDRDKVAVEEPLEIQIGFERKGVAAIHSISVTMRTPGNDEELASGFLFGEGLLNRRSELARIERNEGHSSNQVRIHLAAGVRFDLKHLERHFYTTSSCGICGKASLEAVQRLLLTGPRANSSLRLSVATVHSLPSQLKRAQQVFADTGGLHGADGRHQLSTVGTGLGLGLASILLFFWFGGDSISSFSGVIRFHDNKPMALESTPAVLAMN